MVDSLLCLVPTADIKLPDEIKQDGDALVTLSIVDSETQEVMDDIDRAKIKATLGDESHDCKPSDIPGEFIIDLKTDEPGDKKLFVSYDGAVIGTADLSIEHKKGMSSCIFTLLPKVHCSVKSLMPRAEYQ